MMVVQHTSAESAGPNCNLQTSCHTTSFIVKGSFHVFPPLSSPEGHLHTVESFLPCQSVDWPRWTEPFWGRIKDCQGLSFCLMRPSTDSVSSGDASSIPFCSFSLLRWRSCFCARHCRRWPGAHLTGTVKQWIVRGEQGGKTSYRLGTSSEFVSS